MSKKEYQSPKIEITVFKSDSVTSLQVSATQASYSKFTKTKLTNKNVIDF